MTRDAARTAEIMARAMADATMMMVADEIRRRRDYDRPGARVLRAIGRFTRTVASGGWD